MNWSWSAARHAALQCLSFLRQFKWKKVRTFILFCKPSLYTGTQTLTDLIRLEGSLEATLGDDVTLICYTSSAHGSELLISEMTLRLQEQHRVFRVGFNNTHARFELRNTVASDNGRMLSCSVSEFSSFPRPITIISKILVIILKSAWDTTKFSPYF